MNRSRDYVYVPFCMLSQGIRATSIVKKYPAIVNPVVELLMKRKINIVQMPCPELIFDGFNRRPCGKPHYDTPANRKVCKEVAKSVVAQMVFFREHGCKIRLVMGIDYSPSCAVSVITGGFHSQVKKGKGIFIEELQHVMREKEIRLPFVGVRVYKINETIEALKKNL